MRAATLVLGLAAMLASVDASFTKRANVKTWSMPGARYRAREVTVPDSPVVIPTRTFHLRSTPSERNVKRAFLNNWSFQGCADDDDKLPDLVSPFSYEILPEDVSGASCSHVCDERGNSLAALQNGNECWCGEKAEGITFVDNGACNAPCAAAAGETCGAKDKLTMYVKP